MRFPLRLEVVLTPSEEVRSLREQVKQLHQCLDDLQASYNRVELLYRSECSINLELQDILRREHIPYREAIAKYTG